MAGAAPTYVGKGGAIASVGSAVVAWASSLSYLPGDIGLLVVESCGGEAVTLSTPAGFTEVTGSPFFTGAGATGTRVTVFWRRLDTVGTPASVTIADAGDHVIGQIYVFRGCEPLDDPWDVVFGGVDAASTTAVTIPGGTTTVDNCLLVQVATRDLDSSSVTMYSGQANSNLSDLAERGEAGYAGGNGGGFVVYTGVLATAGASGDTTATTSSASVNAYITIALRPPQRAPYFWDTLLGASASTGFQGIPWPDHRADDIGLLYVQTANEPFTAPTDWTEVSASPQGTGTAGTAGSTALQVFWKRATSSSEPNVTVPDAGDHIVSRLTVFRGCSTSVDPALVSGGSVKGTASTSSTWPAITTTVDDCLIVNIVGSSLSSLGPAYSAQANANLTNLWEHFDAGNNTQGLGGYLSLSSGVLEVAGDSGATTATCTSATEAYITLALRPEPSAPSGAITGATAIALSSSATATGAGVLSGSATVALSPVATLSGAVPATGSTNLTMTPAGSLAGQGALAGSVAIALAPSGSVTGAGSLTGASTLALSPSATLTATGTLSGSTTLALAVSGSLDAPASDATGSTTLALAASGSLSGDGALAGEASASLGGVATLDGAGELTGASSVSIATTADGVLVGALTGAASMALAPAGDVTGAGALSGAASLALTSQAAVGGDGALSGATTLGLSTQGDIRAVARMTGTAGIAFDATATGSLLGFIDGAALIAVALVGELLGRGALAGSTSLTLTPHGAGFTASGRLPTIAARPDSWADGAAARPRSAALTAGRAGSSSLTAARATPSTAIVARTDGDTAVAERPDAPPIVAKRP